MKVVILFAVLAVALADRPPAPYHPAPAPYRPAPYKEEKLPPQPFQYQYGVKDDYSGANFEKAETQDSYGNLEGSYRVALPDGRVQIVTYKADQENGFIADVSYEGVPQYPPEPAGGYGAKPVPHGRKYAPVPAPKYVPA